MSTADHDFTGSIAEVYDEYMVPLLFEPYAADLTARVVLRRPKRLLELAAGTGVVTRHLCAALPPEASIVATDLNPSMLARATKVGTSRPVEWRPADAQHLPFDDGSFDAVVCQFGVMFFPDKVRAFAEARRVLAPDGVLFFNVWDRLEANAFALTVSSVLEASFPKDPPRFLARTPHGWFDRATIVDTLARAGFAGTPQLDTVALRSRAPTARHAAVALVQGTPVRNDLEARGASLAEITDRATAAIAATFGPGPVEGAMQAQVVRVQVR
jgi:ubiquinone/menaquinone biosynthesis C-methylase UbiE